MVHISASVTDCHIRHLRRATPTLALRRKMPRWLLPMDAPVTNEPTDPSVLPKQTTAPKNRHQVVAPSTADPLPKQMSHEEDIRKMKETHTRMINQMIDTNANEHALAFTAADFARKEWEAMARVEASTVRIVPQTWEELSPRSRKALRRVCPKAARKLRAASRSQTQPIILTQEMGKLHHAPELGVNGRQRSNSLPSSTLIRSQELTNPIETVLNSQFAGHGDRSLAVQQGIERVEDAMLGLYT